MKKLFVIAAIAGSAVACNNAGDKPATTDSPTVVTPAPASGDTLKTAQPALKDGLMTLKDGKVQIVANGAWAQLDSTVTCTNGRKVSPDGTVAKGDKKRKLEDGMMIDKDGQLMDKSGKPMDTSGWD